MDIAALKSWAKKLKLHVLMVYFAARDSRTPLWVRAFAFALAAYAFSPIDLIPDFIPVIGYLDDLVIIPLGVMLVFRLTPSVVMTSARSKAQSTVDRPVSYPAAACIVSIWLVLSGLFVYWLAMQYASNP